MNQQQSLSMQEDRNGSFLRPRGRRTKREVFLEQMEQIVPWVQLTAVIEPHYPKAGNGWPPIGLERMLRIHFMQHWFNLADEACEDALYDSAAFRSFAGIDLGSERAPDATTLLKFRRLLEQHRLGEALMERVNGCLKASGVQVGNGTIVDATIIAAPSSTKNKRKARDPEIHQTKKGNQWYFGMKLHVGADSRGGVVHSAEVSAANTHDSRMLPQLMHGEERRLYGDSAYRGEKQKAAMRAAAPEVKDFTNERAHRNRPLSNRSRDVCLQSDRLGTGAARGGCAERRVAATVRRRIAALCLALICPGYFWCAWHLWCASRTVPTSLLTRRAASI